MKIEVGKYYRLRDGTEVGPLAFNERNGRYPFFANGYSWTEDGDYLTPEDYITPGEGERDDPNWDIVAELPDPHTAINDPILRVSATGAVKASIGKRPLHLLPRDAIEAVADVMAHGAAKYRARDWEQGLSVSDLVRAADGHLWDWYLRRDDGKDAGPNGTGLSHLAHAACSILFLLSHELRGLPDDRPAPVPAVPQPTREG